MKKIYMTPEFEVVKVELANMIALSKTEGEANPQGEVLSRGNEWEDANARRKDVWEEEEEEQW